MILVCDIPVKSCVTLVCDLQSSGLKRAHVNLNRQISFAGKSARMASWASRLVSRRIYKHMQYEDARTFEPGASDGLSAACIHCNQRQDRHERRFSGLYCNNQVTFSYHSIL